VSVWDCSSPATYFQAAAAAGFIYYRSQKWALHSPRPTGFVYLEFSWTHAPFVFPSIQSYPPVAIALLFYLEFKWGHVPPPLSGGACHTLAIVGHLLLSKHTGGGGATPTFSGLLNCLFTVHKSECLSPTLQSSGTSTFYFRCLFFSAACLLFSFFLFIFSLGRGQSVHGAMLICSREYCMLIICSPGGLPSRVVAPIWQCGSPPGFSI
jgi:hypothetical protein